MPNAPVSFSPNACVPASGPLAIVSVPDPVASAVAQPSSPAPWAVALAATFPDASPAHSPAPEKVNEFAPFVLDSFDPNVALPSILQLPFSAALADAIGASTTPMTQRLANSIIRFICLSLP